VVAQSFNSYERDVQRPVSPHERENSLYQVVSAKVA